MLNDLLYNGIQVIEHRLATVSVPIKEHKWNGRKERESYHKRIQKKWTNRFGTKQVPGCYMMAGKMFAHPDVIKKLREVV
jgi:hypothetical protein